jgi:hypothetical protein
MKINNTRTEFEILELKCSFFICHFFCRTFQTLCNKQLEEESSKSKFWICCEENRNPNDLSTRPPSTQDQ